LFENRGDSGLESLGAGSVINGGDRDLRRREVGELCYGKCGDADGASKNNEEGADGGENRAMNKKIDH
jgi:hypothetical protein